MLIGKIHPAGSRFVETGGKLHLHGVFREQFKMMYLLLRDEGEVAGKWMDGGRNKHHKQGPGCHLKRRGSGSHDKAQSPESISREWKGDDGAPAESGSEIKQVGHPLECEINAVNERNPFQPVFEMCHEALSNDMG